MKQEERHKLKTNELIDAVASTGAWVKSHTRLLVSVAVLLILAIGLWWFIHYQQQAGLEKAWDGLAKAKTSDDFARIVRDHPNNAPVTAIALYRQGYEMERDGNVERAEGFYKRVLEQPYHPLVTPLARLAMAHAEMSRGPSNFNDLRDSLTKIVTDPKADAGVRLMTADDQRLLLAAEQWDLNAPSMLSEPVEMQLLPTTAPAGKSGSTTTRDEHK